MIDMLQRHVEAQASMIADLQETIKGLKETIQNLESLLRERDSSLSKASSQMRGLKAVYGPKKSEKVGSEAADVNREKTEEEKAEEAKAREEARKARGNNGAKHKDHYAVETVEEDVYPGDIDISRCVRIGVRDVIRYEMIGPRFIKHVYHIHTVREGDAVLSGRTPLSPLLNSRFDGSFIAGIAELRYLQSMPVERIVKYFRDHGFDIDKQTAHGLLAKTADLFDKLYEALESAVKEDRYLHCDETYHTVLVKADDNGGKGSRKGYIWVIIGATTGLAYFFYDDGSRSSRVILDKLEGYRGIIQSDGLRAYKDVAERSAGDIVRVACLQHCKRDFLDDSIKENPDAKEVTRLTNLLYHNDHKHRIGENGWTIEDNLRWRREYAPPILDALKAKLQEIYGNLEKYPPTSLMHKAAGYFLNEWDGIEAISHYGHVDWDNNRLERMNRYISMSRRSSLFFGSHAGAERGCIFYSLACSCREHGINFFEYLSDVLNRTAALPPGTSMKEYRKLLPDQWEKE